MAVKDRFEQPSYQFFSTIEHLLIKAINSESYQAELEALNKHKDDLDVSALPAEIQVLQTICANKKVFAFQGDKKQDHDRNKQRRTKPYWRCD